MVDGGEGSSIDDFGGGGFEVGVVAPSIDFSTWGKGNGSVGVDVEFAYGDAMMKGRGDHGWR